MNGSSGSHDQKVLQEFLRDLRSEAGLRQVDVARKLGLPQPMVSKYEAGERRLDILELRKLCKILNLTLSQFSVELEKRLAKK